MKRAAHGFPEKGTRSWAPRSPREVRTARPAVRRKPPQADVSRSTCNAGQRCRRSPIDPIRTGRSARTLSFRPVRRRGLSSSARLAGRAADRAAILVGHQPFVLAFAFSAAARATASNFRMIQESGRFWSWTWARRKAMSSADRRMVTAFSSSALSFVIRCHTRLNASDGQVKKEEPWRLPSRMASSRIGACRASTAMLSLSMASSLAFDCFPYGERTVEPGPRQRYLDRIVRVGPVPALEILVAKEVKLGPQKLRTWDDLLRSVRERHPQATMEAVQAEARSWGWEPPDQPDRSSPQRSLGHEGEILWPSRKFPTATTRSG
jgi:hypothetical protein